MRPQERLKRLVDSQPPHIESTDAEIGNHEAAMWNNFAAWNNWNAWNNWPNIGQDDPEHFGAAPHCK